MNHRRWFRFSLATLFLLMTTVSVGVWWNVQPPLPFPVTGNISRADIKAILAVLSRDQLSPTEISDDLPFPEIERRVNEQRLVGHVNVARRKPVLAMERTKADEIEVRTGVTYPTPPGGGWNGEGYTITFRKKNGLWEATGVGNWKSASHY